MWLLPGVSLIVSECFASVLIASPPVRRCASIIVKFLNDMTDREIFHKLLDEILDSGNMSAIYTEFFPGIPNKIPALQKNYRLEIKEASFTTTKTEL